MSKNPKLETLCIRLTKHCNLSCSHCRAGSSPYTQEKNEVDKLKKIITDFISIGLKHVSISGGEPFIDKRMPSFANWLLNQGLHVTITTNSTVPVLDFFESNTLNPSKKLRLRVSIDGKKVFIIKLEAKVLLKRPLKHYR